MVREAVLALRREKSMVLDPVDPNRRSAGSFFTNPVLEAAEAEEVARRAEGAGLSARAMPRFETPDGRVKLSAAWLIERSGMVKGTRRGPVGISSQHCLALVHHGGGATADLLGLAAEVRARVEEKFGVLLEPEPTLVGCEV
jgi:UDP-N-acetylmuramate dehydrogenase